MKAKLLKRMVSLGEQLEVGDIVDVSTWRLTKSLVSNRYIVLVEDEPVKIEEKVKEAPKKKTSKAKTE
jgi:hypothetical protein